MAFALILIITTAQPARAADARCNLSSGGTLTSYESGGVLYCVSTFTADGTFQWNGTNATVVDFVIVGGGGGGNVGGGGSGGVLQGFLTINSNTSWGVTVGQGGQGHDVGSNGTNSTVFGLVAGGGAGGGPEKQNGVNCPNNNSTAGATFSINIGCGGGGGGSTSGNPSKGGTGGSPNGNNGGDSSSGNGEWDGSRAGGGGGAGTAGTYGYTPGIPSAPTNPGSGGAAVATTVTASPLTVASGGNGMNSYGVDTNTTYPGSGGNGFGKNDRDGKNGIVIVRYAVDITAPTVSSVSVPSAGSYAAGDTLSFTVNTSEAVTVTGTPQIALTIGSTTRQATYVSGTGTSSLVFSYTVQASETDTDGIAVGTLSANDGTLKDAAGNDMNLTLNSVGSTAAVLVDTTAPSVSIQNAPTAVNSTTAFSVTLEFSESVTGFTLGDIAVANGAASSLTGSGTTYTADITPDGNGTIEIDVAANIAQDSAGNNNSAATQVTVAYDTTAPTAPTIGTSNGTTLSGTAEAGATVTIYASDGTTLATTTADGSGNWSITNPLSDGETGSIKVTDTAGNTSSATAIAAVDATAPTAPTIGTSNGTTLSGTAEAGSTVTIYASDGTTVRATTTADGSGNWSIPNPLSDGETGSVKITDTAGNTSSATAIAAVDATAPTAPTIGTSNGTTLSGTAEAGATVTIYASDGTTLATTTADGSGNWSITNPLSDGETGSVKITDTAGNTSSATAIAAVDATATAPTIGTSNGTTLSGTAEAGSTVTIYASDGTTVLATTTADGSGNWSVTNPLSDGQTGSVKVTDTAGNTSSATAIAAVDAIAPTAPTIDTSNGSTLSGTAEAGSTVTIYASDGTTVLATTTADGSGNWSVTNPLSDGQTGSVKVTDAAGNTSSSTAITAVDATAPSMTITAVGMSDGDSSDDATLSLTFTASETTSDFTKDAITVTNATLGTLSGSGATYTITLTPLSTGAVTVDVAAGTFTDSAGNNNIAATQFNWTYGVDPTTKADVIGSVESSVNAAVNFSTTSIKTVNNRLAFLRNNTDKNKTSRQGIKVSFADPLINAYVNGTQSGIASLGFDERAAAEALTQVAANPEGATASLSDKPVEVVMAEMKDIFGTVNLNPTAGALVGDWSVWTEGQITIGEIDASTNSAAQDSDSINIAVGMDRPYGDLGLIGVALNIGQDDIDIGSSGSQVESDNLSLSFYNVKQLPNKLGLETQFGLGKMAIDTKRIDGAQTLTGERDATMAFGSISLRDEPLVKGSATITPYGRAEWAYIEFDGYAETGGNLALNYDKQHINRYMLFLGSDVTYETTYANGKLKPFAAFEYGLDMTRDSDVGMNYVGDTTTYSTKLEKTATSNLMLRLGADYEMKDGVTSSFAYERTEALGAGFSNSLRFHVNVPLD